MKSLLAIAIVFSTVSLALSQHQEFSRNFAPNNLYQNSRLILSEGGLLKSVYQPTIHAATEIEYGLLPSYRLGYTHADSLSSKYLKVVDRGIENYHTTSAITGYNKMLSNKIMFAAEVSYAYLQRDEVSNGGYFKTQVGAKYDLDMVAFYAVFANVFDRQSDQLYSIGTVYQDGDYLIMAVGYLNNGIVSYQIGLEYVIQRIIAFKLAYSSFEGELYGGLVFKKKNLIATIATSYNFYLGLSPEIGISYAF